jgi:4-diphosphocytidyl-2-C-methyl-D-erythritol kinase
MPQAYAKINLGLQILRKREDRYHDIETVLYPVNIFDTIEFRHEEREIIIESTDPTLPVDRSNLCWKAADALRRVTNVRRGVRILIEKKIPIGAGLGGGSSDAGCVLRELPSFYGVSINRDRLHEIALSLGSDVPYFLQSGAALAMGRGDVLEYFDFSLPYWIVIVYPNIHISTRWAYEQWKPTEDLKRVDLRQLLIKHVDEPRVWVNKLRNDFEGIVFRTHEAVMRTKEGLYVAGADFAQMSGSGSAVYGLFKNEQTAREVADMIGENLPVFVTEPHFKPAP